MNARTPTEWDDLSEQWRSKSTPIALEDVQRRARQHRIQLAFVLLAELIAASIGAATAVWILFSTTMLFVGLGFGIAIVIFTLAALRWQSRYWSVGLAAENAIITLDAAIAREEGLCEVLRVGHGVLLAAALTVVVASASHLMQFEGGSAASLLPFAASALYLIGMLSWGALLYRAAKRRTRVFRKLRDELSYEPEL
jgi:hypothetical protein